jgi:hypothetical protein
MSYDSACYDLAVSFLEGGKFDTEANRDALAQEIQQTIEDFLHDLEDD